MLQSLFHHQSHERLREFLAVSATTPAFLRIVKQNRYAVSTIQEVAVKVLPRSIAV